MCSTLQCTGVEAISLLVRSQRQNESAVVLGMSTMELSGTAKSRPAMELVGDASRTW